MINLKSYTNGTYHFYKMKLDHLKKESDFILTAVQEVGAFLDLPDLRDNYPPCIIGEYQEHKKQLLERHEQISITAQNTQHFLESLRVIDQNTPDRKNK